MIDLFEFFNVCLYIEANLEADLSLLVLARTVGLSRFRFHRVFKAWRGETLHDFVIRTRMEHAALELAYPSSQPTPRTVQAIALAYGYKSLSSFSHAFSDYAGVSPRAFRRLALQARAASARADAPVDRIGRFPVAIRSEPAHEIVVLARDDLERDVPAGQDRVVVESLPTLFARIACGRTPRATCVGIIRTAPSVANRGRPAVVRLDAGRYAVIESAGSLFDLYRDVRRHVDAWLAATGERPRPGRVFVRFRGDGGFALHLPLATRASAGTTVAGFEATEDPGADPREEPLHEPPAASLEPVRVHQPEPGEGSAALDAGEAGRPVAVPLPP